MRAPSNIAILLLAAVFWIGPASAQQTPNAPVGRKFIALCKSPTVSGRNACGGVVIALMNAHVEMARQDPSRRIICPPRILSVEEGRRVFNQWAAITPAAANMPFPDLVMTALTKRYPCSTFRAPKRAR